MVRLNLDTTEYHLHRLIVGDVPDGYEVDHIDKNPLISTGANLRIVTRSQKLNNRGKWGKSEFKGVCKVGSKFRASATQKDKTIFIGEFDTATEAAMMRDKVVQCLAGDYAHYNFPQEQRMLPTDNMQQVTKVLKRNGITM